jgi:hypothetical protein
MIQLLCPGTWDRVLQRADAAVAEDSAAGFTTLLGFFVTQSFVCGSSCGDSAAILLQNQASRILTDRQEKNPPVGSRVAVSVGFAASLIRPWTMLAMSDGVWKYAGWDRIVKIASEKRGPEIVEGIREQGRMQGSGGFQDDFTLVVFQDNGQETAPAANGLD